MTKQDTKIGKVSIDQVIEERANAAFRRVRNRLRKHFPKEIVAACINKLNEHPDNKIGHLRSYSPWRLLLLIKWTFVYGDYLSPKRKRLTTYHFNYLLNLMHDFEGSMRLPTEHDSLLLFFRKMAFQQFWLQHELSVTALARQSILFASLEANHPFQTQFLEKAGVPISEFIELSIMLTTRFFIEKKKSVSVEWFKTVNKSFRQGTIESFLNFLSSDFDSLRDHLIQSEQVGKKPLYEAYENTPLAATPMLKHGLEYTPFSPYLLVRSLETAIYDTLKADDRAKFMERFGGLFERYVENSISATGLPFLNENHLREALPGNGKVVDYLLIDEDAAVFIDSKGVEMAYLGMVGYQREIIKDRSKDSVLKGIQQGLETAIRLKAVQHIGQLTFPKSKNYLIVVTYKDLFLGNGTDFYQYVAKDTLDRIVAGYKDIQIPFEHMYFMQIEDFDLLMGSVASGESRLKDILELAVKSDGHPSTKKFTFDQHIWEACPDAKPPTWLIAEAKSITNRCVARFDVPKSIAEE